ncbi:MAG: homoserine kinase [Parvibaculales bacterium]
MAVYTTIDNQDLAGLLDDYDIGAATDLKGIAEGVENSNFILTTETGKFILTIYEKRVKRDDLPFFLELKTHLNARGFPCPLPIARTDGGLISSVKGQPAAIISFLPGSSMRRPQSDHCFAFGKAMAELHLAGESFGQQRKNDLSLPVWQDMFDALRDECDGVFPNLKETLGGHLDHLRENWPDALPEGVIHADLFIDNVFFVNEHLSGVIDFYFACTDMLAYDIAIALNAWCFEADVNFNITKAKAILDGYQTVRPLSTDEINALPVLARGAAVRFLLTRLHDWLHQDPDALVRPKNPVDYLRRLRFHKTAIRPEDYGITAGAKT